MKGRKDKSTLLPGNQGVLTGAKASTNAPVIFLREDQADCYHQGLTSLLGGAPRFGVSCPMGWGKSLETQALVEGFLNCTTSRGAVVAVPQVQIADSFLKQYDIRVPSQKGVTTTNQMPWRWGPHGKLASKDQLVNYFHHPMPKDSSHRVLVTSHKSLGDLFKVLDQDGREVFPKGAHSLKGMLLVVDEAHHSSKTNLLGRFVTRWVEAGGQVLFLTATPFRSDDDPLSLRRDDPCFFRSMSDWLSIAMSLPEARRPPRTIRPEWRMLTSQVETDPDENPLKFIDQSQADEIAEMWVKDQRPKTIMNLPMAGLGRDWVEPIRLAFEKQGAKVYNAFPKTTTSTDSREFRDILAWERACGSFNDSKVDVIIACLRFGEGSDWPLASFIYNLGINQSSVLTVQKGGRVFRPRWGFEPYSGVNLGRNEYVNDAIIRFIIPVSMPKERRDLYVVTNIRAIHLLGTFMADPVTGDHYQAHLRTRPEDLGRKRDGSKVSDPEVASHISRSIDGSNHVIPELFVYTEILKDRGEKLTTPNFFGLLDELVKDPENKREYQLAFAWAQVKTQSQEQQDRFTQALEKRLRAMGRTKKASPIALDQAIIDAFTEVVDDFRKTRTHEESAIELLTKWVADDIKDLGQSLKVRLQKQWERLYNDALAFYQANTPGRGMEALNYRDPEHSELIKWVNEQRRLHRRLALSSEQLEKLKRIQLNLVSGSRDFLHHMINLRVNDATYIPKSDSSEMGRFIRQLRGSPTPSQRAKVNAGFPGFIWDNDLATFAHDVQEDQADPDTLVRGTKSYLRFRDNYTMFHRGLAPNGADAYMDHEFGKKFDSVYREDLADWFYDPSSRCTETPLGLYFLNDKLLTVEREVLFGDWGMAPAFFSPILSGNRVNKDLSLDERKSRRAEQNKKMALHLKIQGRTPEQAAQDHRGRSLYGLWWRHLTNNEKAAMALV